MNRVIITGGTGFIGRNLVKRLSNNKQFSVVLIANTSSLSGMDLSERSALTYHSADIRDREAILNIFKDERADICIHLAAKISVADSIRKPKETMDINVKGTRNVLEACESSGINSFVFASSAAVYGDVKELPISEDESLRPLSPYGMSKMLAEKHVLLYKQQKKIENAISLRIFNVYGYGQSSGVDVSTTFAESLLNGLAPVIYGDGTQTRDFISIADVTDALMLSIDVIQGRGNNHKFNTTSRSAFNIGTGTPTRIKDLAEKMITIMGLDLQPIYKSGNECEKSILHSYADTSRSRDILDFVPKKGIETGLREMIGEMTSRNLVKEKFDFYFISQNSH